MLQSYTKGTGEIQVRACDLEKNCFRLISLMELLQTNADIFCRIFLHLGQALSSLSYAPATDGVVDAACRALAELQSQAEKLELRSTLQHLKRLERFLDDPSEQQYQGRLRTLLTKIGQRMIDELDSRVFLSVPFEKTELYDQKN